MALRESSHQALLQHQDTLLCSGSSLKSRRNKAHGHGGGSSGRGPRQGEAVAHCGGQGMVPTGASAGADPPVNVSSLPADRCPGGPWNETNGHLL